MKIEIHVKCSAKVGKCVQFIFASPEDRTLTFFKNRWIVVGQWGSPYADVKFRQL